MYFDVIFNYCKHINDSYSHEAWSRKKETLVEMIVRLGDLSIRRIGAKRKTL